MLNDEILDEEFLELRLFFPFAYSKILFRSKSENARRLKRGSKSTQYIITYSYRRATLNIPAENDCSKMLINAAPTTSKKYKSVRRPQHDR